MNVLLLTNYLYIFLDDCASHKYTKYLRKPHECLPRFTPFLEDTKSYVESWSVLFDSNIRQAREQKPATFRLPTLKSGTPHSVQFSLVTTGSASVPENSSSTTDKMPDPFAEKGGSSTIDSINAASPTSLTKDAWTYQTAAELEESGTMAVLDWYPGGGYTVELPRVIEVCFNILLCRFVCMGVCLTLHVCMYVCLLVCESSTFNQM